MAEDIAPDGARRLTDRCECEEPDPTGTLNGGVEVCRTCTYTIGGE